MGEVPLYGERGIQARCREEGGATGVPRSSKNAPLRSLQCRFTSFIRNSSLQGPCSRTIQGHMAVLGGGGRFILGEVPL